MSASDAKRVPIVGVAICDRDGTVHQLPRPNRHHHVIRMMADAGHETPIIGEQGFITDEGKFIRRRPAGMLAKACGQIDALKWPPDLYSEDLW